LEQFVARNRPGGVTCRVEVDTSRGQRRTEVILDVVLGDRAAVEDRGRRATRKYPIAGKLGPELVIELFEKMFPMLPVAVPVSMKMVPLVTEELAPLMVQFVTRLFEASPIR
jgi:hypothetical protein